MSPPRPAADRISPAFTETEARELLKPLAACRHVGLAVSGGSDSVGLMLLAARAGLGGQTTVLTVDHGLRPQSGAEAGRVVEWARGLGFDAEILRWEDPKPRTGVQERAREARYRLMADWCARRGADAVATGHTLDDQAETLLMRLARGSGVDGLSAMPATTMRHGIAILRPLLGVERRRLARLAVQSGHDFIADPSNDDPAFERVRIRRAESTLAALGLTRGAIGLAVRRLQRARVALDAATDRLQATAVTVAPEMYAIIDASAYGQAAEELRIRLLSRLLAAMGGASEAAELSQIERAAAWLAGGQGSARTLGGCRIHHRPNHFLVGREGGRMTTAPVSVEQGETVLFDGRFRVRVERAPPGPLRLEALGKAAGTRLERPASLPAFVFETLPAVIHGGEVAAVPHLGYRRDGPEGAVLAEVKPSIAWASEFLYDSANLATDRRVLMLH
jgi:tRNA(Ile)-lysidine synthase